MKSISRTITSITAESALKIVEAAIVAGQNLGIPVSVAVCGPELNLVAFARADGATPHSAETSRRKAQTAASTGKSTGWMGAELAISLPLGTGNLLTNIPGGLPVRVEGALIGGLGVAGGSVEQDVVVATEALRILNGDNNS